MTTAKKFFAGKQPAAVLKHELLSRYLRVYVQKTGSTSKDKRVAYVDGYAGPGTYDDGSEGSPAVAVQTAAAVRGANDRIDGYFIEKESSSVEALADYLKAEGLAWPVFQGDVEDALPQVLDMIHKDTSLFVFLDPFGLGVPMDLLGRILDRTGPVRYGYRTEGAATEVLLNFSFPGLRRNAGHLMSEKGDSRYRRARESIIARVDATLGGDWWHDIWAQGAEDREDVILRGYLDRLSALGPGGWSWWSVPVADGWDRRPSYRLIQLTQHRDGHWEFHETLSNAVEPYRTACHEYEGKMDLEPLEQREAQWVEEIKKNVEELLSTGKSFGVQDKLGEVFGEAKGLARTKHLRKAVKELHKEGKTSTTGVGDMQDMRIKPPA